MELALKPFHAHLSKSFSAKLDKEQKQISITLKVGETDVWLFTGILHDRILQMICYLPLEVKKESRGELAEFLHSVNRQLDVPGFCLDDQGRIFYRVVIPCLHPKVEERLVDAHIRTIQAACHQVLQALQPEAKPEISRPQTPAKA